MTLNNFTFHYKKIFSKNKKSQHKNNTSVRIRLVNKTTDRVRFVRDLIHFFKKQ